MKITRDIAVGVELGSGAVTPASRRAAERAAWLARRTIGRVALIHSVWSEAEGGPLAVQGADRVLDALAQELRAQGVKATVAITRERPWVALVQRAVRLESDVVFVAKRDGDHGRELGANTAKLLRKCPCPVWAVHPDRPLVLRSILAATDLSPVGELVVGMAADLSAMSGSELHVVHAWQRTMEHQLSAAGEGDARARERVEALESGLRDRILGALGPRQATVTPLLHVGCSSPERAILDGVRALDPDLVVMGTLSRRGIPGMLIGNTAERVLARIPTSLLTVKPEGFESPVSA